MRVDAASWHVLIADYHFDHSTKSLLALRKRLGTDPEGFFYSLDGTVASEKEKKRLVKTLFPSKKNRRSKK